MNHLKPKGRAGIIVPEGIIFQSGKAYKELRKNLVNDGLFAVVSLPAGVFNPYSGVKTSILFFDNEIAKKTKDLLFVKVTSDGYDLGAQRRKIEKDDLGDAGVILKGFREYVRTYQNKETIESFISGSGKGFIVSKEKIAETDDYNLSADRYKVNEISNTKYPFVRLGEVIDYVRGVTFSKKDQVYEETSETIRVATTKAAQEHGLVEKDLYFIPKKIVKKDDQILRSGDILISIANSLNLLGRTTYIEDKNTGITFGAFMGLIRAKEETIEPKYLFRILRTPHAKKYFESNANTTTNISNLTSTTLLDYEIPLPPLDVQKEIVEQIEVKQKAIEGAKQVIENLERERRYFGQSLRKLDNVDMVELGNKTYFDIESGGTPSTTNQKFWNGDINWVTLVDLPQENFITQIQETERKITEDGLKGSSAKLLSENTVLVSSRATIGRIGIAKNKLATNQGFKNIIIKDKNKISSLYLAIVMTTKKDEMELMASGGTFKEISKTSFEKIIIPIPDLSTQQKIINEYHQEQGVIESNKKLIEIMEKKIEEVLETI